jgi:phage shock protein A
MTLFTRLGRLFYADVHEILDCIEDPEAVVKQALRDMEAEVGKDQELIEQLKRAQEELAAERTCKQEVLDDTEQQINAAFSAKEENLAKSFIKRKLITIKRIADIERETTRVQSESKRASVRLEERKAKLAATTEKLALYQAAQKEHERRGDASLTGMVVETNCITDDDVEIAFIQEKERRHMAQA